ncbi:MAG: MbnP family protein, partial [Chitinophagaceae bacterium]
KATYSGKEINAKKMAAIKYLFSVSLLLLSVSGFNQQRISLQFLPYAANKSIALGIDTITNAANETMVINRFQFYLYDFCLIDDKGKKEALTDSVFLIDMQNESTSNLRFSHKMQQPVAISWKIGVDSIQQTTGVQTGSLDPLNGMFWTWKTGYIYAKLEGQSPYSKAAGRYVSYHVGGYQTGENALQAVTIPIKTSVTPNHTFTVKTNILAWFEGDNKIVIAEQPVCHKPGSLAMQLAANYKNMFSLQLVND